MEKPNFCELISIAAAAIEAVLSRANKLSRLLLASRTEYAGLGDELAEPTVITAGTAAWLMVDCTDFFTDSS